MRQEVLERKLDTVMDYVLVLRASAAAPEYLTAGAIARVLDVDLGEAGKLIQRSFPVAPVKGKGYPTEGIFYYLDAMLAAEEEASSARFDLFRQVAKELG